MIVDPNVFTWLHILISLVALAAGFIVLGGFLCQCRSGAINHVFIVMTIATSASGFMFPFRGLLPSHVVGAISLVIMAVACHAYYIGRLAGSWNTAYVIAAIAALYLNTFVLVAQTFLKNPALLQLAPTQSEPPFVATQGLVLVAFLAVGYLAWSRTARGAAPGS